MTRSYKLVLMGDAVPGMVLSDDLLDRHSKVLLAGGTMLNEKMLESLRRHEMDMIPVFCEELTEGEVPARIAKRQERLEQLFRKHNYDEPEAYANDVLLQYMRAFRRGGNV